MSAVFGQNDPGGGDAAVLAFDVTTTSPGFLRVSFVFGSDEAPFFLTDPYNDSFAILIDGENVATLTKNSVSEAFTLQSVAQCPKIYLKNDVAPLPVELVGSGHGTDSAPFYDIEFGGFTKRLTRETRNPIVPGKHTVKIVIQDVADRRLDSALFIADSSLKLFSIANGDYNNDGIVGAGDYTVWANNLGMTPATFHDGDGSFNGVVDAADWYVWHDHYGETGNRVWRSDFDRSGIPDDGDFVILLQYYGQLAECASRFEGDANGDGAVTGADFTILLEDFDEYYNGGGGGEALMAGEGGENEQLNALMAEAEEKLGADLASQWQAAIKRKMNQIGSLAEAAVGPYILAKLPDSPDADHDGDVDQDDVAIMNEMLGLSP